MLAAALVGPVAAQSPPRTAAQPFAFQVEEGRNLNAFFRQGPVAAHLLVRSGTRPRIIVAFPAGNSGTGLWFAPSTREVRWSMVEAPSLLQMSDHAGRPLYGIASTISTQSPELVLGSAVLSSVRVLRDFELRTAQPAEVTARPVTVGSAIVWQRDRLDGAAGYRLKVEVLDGAIDNGRIVAGGDGRITLRIEALSGEQPLTPLRSEQLIDAAAADDPAARNTLEFLAYREKFLAGSWRFDTYFGRDTLMSVRLLMNALQPEAVEAGLGSVLARLSPQGEVAHEEDIGEFAVLDHMRSDGTKSDAPVYDYKMIDGTPMLAAVAGHWLLDDPLGRNRARSFLVQANPSGRSNGAALVANLERVVSSAARFAANPAYPNLIALKPGFKVGNWRDSEDGLGSGRYPYDVNAALMPAALDAAARLGASGLLDPWLGPRGRQRLREASRMAAIWARKAPALFEVRIAPALAREQVERVAREDGLSAAPAPALPADRDVTFPALSLDGDGNPVPVLNSDVGFRLLFMRPPTAELDRLVEAVGRPYPAGLMSDAGLLTANAVFAPAPIRARFSRSAYHGAVVWSWQQALLLAGIDHQLARKDIPQRTRSALIALRTRLAGAIRANRTWLSSELWSWKVIEGKIRPVAFGASNSDADESNAAQLWSSVYLGIAS